MKRMHCMQKLPCECYLNLMNFVILFVPAVWILMQWHQLFTLFLFYFYILENMQYVGFRFPQYNEMYWWNYIALLWRNVPRVKVRKETRTKEIGDLRWKQWPGAHQHNAILWKHYHFMGTFFTEVFIMLSIHETHGIVE